MYATIRNRNGVHLAYDQQGLGHYAAIRSVNGGYLEFDQQGLGSFLDTIKNATGKLISVILPHPATGAPVAVTVPSGAPAATGMSLQDIGRQILQGAVTGGARAVATSQYGAQAVRDLATEQTSKYATTAMLAVGIIAGVMLLRKKRR